MLDLADPKVLDFITNLAATLIGVFVGALLALVTDRVIRRWTVKEERNRIYENLKGELQTNLARLTEDAMKEKVAIYEVDGKTRQIFLTRFNTAILESVINSGKLTLLNSEAQANLSDLHQMLSLVNVTTDHILDFLTSATERTLGRRGWEGKKILDWLALNLEHCYKGLSELIPETLEGLPET